MSMTLIAEPDSICTPKTKTSVPIPFLEFFAGSGLVTQALSPAFKAVWANDLCPKKADVYGANHGSENLVVGSITDVNGAHLPPAQLAWASFPCQDLSLAGMVAGIHGHRSGLVWQWLRVIDEMPSKPSILVAENVMGLLSTKQGEPYRLLHRALVERGYSTGAVVLDAIHWLPQSRPRVFVVAVAKHQIIPKSLVGAGPTWAHPKQVSNIVDGLADWIWWQMPPPGHDRANLEDIVEWGAPCHSDAVSERNLNLITPRHRALLEASGLQVVAGYKRTRNNQQVLELRFDRVAGCLRTPKGGSSRQLLVLKAGNRWRTRLLTARETARLMGVPDTFRLVGTYNEAYKAMGDAVAVPAVRHLCDKLLSQLTISQTYE